MVIFVTNGVPYGVYHSGNTHDEQKRAVFMKAISFSFTCAQVHSIMLLTTIAIDGVVHARHVPLIAITLSLDRSPFREVPANSGLYKKCGLSSERCEI